MPGCRSNFRTRPTRRSTGGPLPSSLGRHRWQIDILVGGIGTGGTITGAGQVLKQLKLDIQVVAVEPAESSAPGNRRSGPHKIQGIGANFVPDVLDREIYDEIIHIDAETAIAATHELMRKKVCSAESQLARRLPLSRSRAVLRTPVS